MCLSNKELANHSFHWSAYAPGEFRVRQTASAYHHGFTVEEMFNLFNLVAGYL